MISSIMVYIRAHLSGAEKNWFRRVAIYLRLARLLDEAHHCVPEGVGGGGALGESILTN